MVFDDATYDYVAKWTERTQIKYVPNAKKGSTKSAERYEQYSQARTVGEAFRLGSKAEDLLHDYQRKFIEVKRLKTDNYNSIEEQRQAHESFFTHFPPAAATALRTRAEKTFKALMLAEALGVDLQEAQKLREGNETLEMTVGRLLADRTAQVVLDAVQEEGRRVTDREVLSVLRLWMFKKNDTRQNVLPEGKEWVHSDTFGLIRSRTGQYMVTNPTREYPHVTQLLNTWLRDRRPPQLEGEDFPCTSISLNSGYAAKRHRDGNNVGPSMIRGFGDYTGGQLAYWPDDDKSCAVENLAHDDRIPMDISKGLVLFDGLRGHEVDDFEGERFSVVWFSLGKFWKVQQEEREFLDHIGFNIPKGQDMGRISKLLPPPRGYTKCQSLGKMFGIKEKAKVWQWLEEPNKEEDKAAAKLLSTFNQEMETLQARGRRRGETTVAAADPKVKRGPLDMAFARAGLGQATTAGDDQAEASPVTPANMSDSTIAEQAMSGEKRKRGRPRKGDAGGEPARKRAACEVPELASAEETSSAAEEPSHRAVVPAAEAGFEQRAADCQASFPTLNFRPELASLSFKPELAVHVASRSGDFSLLAEVLQAAASHSHPAVPLTNYFRFIIHHSTSLEKQLCDAFDLLASTERVSDTVLRNSVKEAFGVVLAKGDNIAAATLNACQRRAVTAPSQPLTLAAVASVRASPSAHRIGELLVALGSEHRDITYLVQLLQGMQCISRMTVLSALSHAFAITQPPCMQENRAAQLRVHYSPQGRQAALIAMHRAVTLAFGEVGGSSKKLVAALVRDCRAPQLFAECLPHCGTPILPMEVLKTDDAELVLAKLACPAIIVEPLFVGQLVQVHKQDNLLEIYGPDQRSLVGSLEEKQVEAVRSAVKADCVIEAVLQEGGNLLALDCLVLDGQPLTRESLRDRRAAMSEAVVPNACLELVQSEEVATSDVTPEVVKGMLEEARSEGWRGLILKSPQGEYEAGTSSTACFALVPSKAGA